MLKLPFLSPEEELTKEVSSKIISIIYRLFDLTDSVKYNKDFSVIATQVLNELVTQSKSNQVSQEIVNFSGQQLELSDINTNPSKILAFIEILSCPNSLKGLTSNTQIILNLLAVLRLPAALKVSEIELNIKKLTWKWAVSVEYKKLTENIQFLIENSVESVDLIKLRDENCIQEIKFKGFLKSRLEHPTWLDQPCQPCHSPFTQLPDKVCF